MNPDHLVSALGVPVALFVLLLGVLWLLFPFIVWWQLGTMLRQQRQQTDLLRRIANNTSPAVQAGTVSAVHYGDDEAETGPGATIAIVVCALLVIGVAALLVARR